MRDILAWSAGSGESSSQFSSFSVRLACAGSHTPCCSRSLCRPGSCVRRFEACTSAEGAHSPLQRSPCIYLFIIVTLIEDIVDPAAVTMLTGCLLSLSGDDAQEVWRYERNQRACSSWFQWTYGIL